MSFRPPTLLVLAALVIAALLASMPGPGSAVARIRPLPIGADADYQLGGAAPPASNVGIVVRDRTARPASGRYNVCYVNGFQTQPDERAFWSRHRSLILTRGGRPVVDEAWGEFLLDIRTPAKRRAIGSIVGGWIRGCARRGFDAVEIDNLDSFSRSGGLLTAAQAIATARLFTTAAHRAGLAIGQKNWAGLHGRRRAAFDFAVAEECGRFDECGAYARVYGRRVLVIEYRRADFDRACAAWGGRLAIELRDLDLTPRGVRDWC